MSRGYRGKKQGGGGSDVTGQKKTLCYAFCPSLSIVMDESKLVNRIRMIPKKDEIVFCFESNIPRSHLLTKPDLSQN